METKIFNKKNYSRINWIISSLKIYKNLMKELIVQAII